MSCSRHEFRDEEYQFLFFTGRMEEGEREETLRHLSRCPECRESFESRREGFRDRMIASAAQRGYLPPDRSGLRERVFRAVARDRAARDPAPRRTTLPLHPRVALVAAAALILVAVGIRYLGDTRWTGRRLKTGGAQLLLTSDGQRFQAVVEGVHEVSQGDTVLVLPGPQPEDRPEDRADDRSGARFDLPDGGRVHLPAPVMIALDEHEGRPRVLLARGYLQVDALEGPGVLVNAAGREFEVHGVAEFTVEQDARTEAFDWVSQALGRTANASFLPSAWAASRPRAVVTAHSREGTVAVRSGERILSGQLRTWRTGSTGTGTPAVRVGGGTALRPISEFLAPDELRVLRTLIRETGGNREALVRVLQETPGAKSPSRPCMAAWLLGELGHPHGVAPLRAVLRTEPLRSPALRSAAAAALLRLLDGAARASIWELASDPQLAVAEAALIGAARAALPDLVSRLTKVFDDDTLPSTLRVLAARLLREAGHPVPDALLAGFLTDEDPSVAALAARTLERHEKGPAHLARFLPEAGDGLAAVILELLVRRPLPAAEAPARKALLRTDGKTDPVSRRLHAAALRILGRLDAPGLEKFVRRALREGDTAAKAAAFSSLTRGAADEYAAELEPILLSPTEDVGIRLTALRFLQPPAAILEKLADDKDPEIRAEVLAWLLSMDGGGKRGELARANLEHPRLILRREAWIWLGRHVPVEAIERAEKRPGTPGGLEAMVDGLFEAGRALPGPPEARLGHLDRIADLYGSVIGGTTDHAGTKDKAALGLRHLAVGERVAAASPRAQAIIRELASNQECPRDLRLRAAVVLARLAENDRDLEILQSILVGDDEGMSSAVAKVYSMTPPPTSAPVVRRFRRVVEFPRARAHLALCEPFDADYAAAVLDSGGARAAAILLFQLNARRVALLRPSLLRHWEGDSRALRILAFRALAKAGGTVEIPADGPGEDDPWIRLARAAIPGGSTDDLDGILREVRSVPLPMQLEKTLDEFEAAPGPETGRTVITQLTHVSLVRSAISEALQHSPPPGPALLLETVKRRVRSRIVRRNALDRLEADPSAANLTRAAEDFKAHGGRADLAMLLRLAADEAYDEETRRRIIRSAATLLGRYVDETEPGQALSELRAWWSERSFALPVPVLPR